jgi:hypothetical protein
VFELLPAQSAGVAHCALSSCHDSSTTSLHDSKLPQGTKRHPYRSGSRLYVSTSQFFLSYIPSISRRGGPKAGERMSTRLLLPAHSCSCERTLQKSPHSKLHIERYWL